MDLFDVFNLDSTAKKRKANDIEEDDVEAAVHEKVDDNLIDQLMSDAKKQKSDDSAVSIVEPSADQSQNDLENFAGNLESFIPRAKKCQIETKGSAVHEVIIPDDLEYAPLRDNSDNPNYKPVKEYKFVLDSFQKEAILCIENNQSVLGKFVLV